MAVNRIGIRWRARHDDVSSLSHSFEGFYTHVVIPAYMALHVCRYYRPF